MPTRRNFIKQCSTLAAAPLLLPVNFAANDTINLGCIGMGIQGFNDVNAALGNESIKMVAACDLYDGRLERAKEVYGKDIFTTRDYRELLSRKDIDAVIVATSDHWHDTITIDALDAGKHVYCEKPLVQDWKEGKAIVDAERRNKGVLMVGSQRVSSILTDKAREIYRSGELGELVMIETFNDRFSPMGAWQYSIPRDASPATVDWDTFLKDTPKMPFDATRFFRWRNYRDYGTGVAGDLFVHLFSGVHRITDSLGPERIFATGGLHYWKDGRDVPDVFIASCDYGDQQGHSAFHMQLRVNFVAASGQGSRTRFVGTEGSLDVSGSEIVLSRDKIPNAPGYGGWDSFGTFPEKTRKEFEQWYRQTYPQSPAEVLGPDSWTYRLPDGYNAHVHHFANWFSAIRNGGKVVEDGAFGLRAAAPSLAANVSYFEKKIVNWDPVQMTVTGD